MNRLRKLTTHFFNGLLAAAGLLAFYFLILRLTNPSWEHAVVQFSKLWYWLLLLDFGFALQVGFYSYLKSGDRDGNAGRLVSASGSYSGASMIACCAHHLVDILPVIGVSGVAVLLVDYQVWFIILGVVSNILALAYMIRHSRLRFLRRSKPVKLSVFNKEVIDYGSG